jgi:aminomethyltransferase
MVPFAGWEMPLQYRSQIEEHHQVRRDAGMFDVSHMLAVDVLGEHAAALLRNVLANDVAKLAKPGSALYSCMLNVSGGVLDDVIVYLLGPQRFRIVFNAGTAEKDLEWVRARCGRFAPAPGIEPRRDLAIIALQGPHARAKFWHAYPALQRATETLAPFECVEDQEMFVARTGYTGEDGFEIMVDASRAAMIWNALHGAGAAPAGLGARDTLRLEAGMNLYGQDMDETVTPFECGLKWTVDMAEGRDFEGKQALERRPVAWQRIGLVLTERGVMRAHQPVRYSDTEGFITSGGFSPTLGKSIALARVPPPASHVAEAEVLLRDKPVRARVVKPPFVRHGKILAGA